MEKKKILKISSIILIILLIVVCILIIIFRNKTIKKQKISDIQATSEDSIIVSKNIDNTVATDIDTKEETTNIIETEEKTENIQETKEEQIENTKDKSTQKTNEEIKQEKNTQEKNFTIQSEKTEIPKTNIPETPKIDTNEEAKKVETKKIDLSKYDYYENSLNGTYKGFIKDESEMTKLKSLISQSIKTFGYTKVKVEPDSSLPKTESRSFTANQTNVENAVYDSEGFTIYYYAVKEYHIDTDGTETLFQTRSYIKVK